MFATEQVDQEKADIDATASPRRTEIGMSETAK